MGWVEACKSAGGPTDWAGRLGAAVETGRVGLRFRSPGLWLPLVFVVSFLIPASAGVPARAELAPSLAVYGWGSNYGATLGSGSDAATVPAPERIPGVQGIAIAAGLYHAFALQPDGTVLSWGGNYQGELGHGTMNTTPPTGTDPLGPVVGLTDVVAISSGFTHALAVRRDGTVWAWGSNHVGQLGLGSQSEGVPKATAVPGLAEIVAAAAGSYHSVALDRQGHIWTWGDAENNQLGRVGDGKNPGRVDGIEGVVAIAAGGDQTVALLGNGHAMFWGGDGNHTPREVPGVEGAVAVAQGFNHALALTGNGTVFGFGATQHGQLGEIGTQVWPARLIAGLEGVSSIAAAQFYSLFTTNDGRILSLGSPQAADTTQNQTTKTYGQIDPRTVATLPGLTSVAASNVASFVLAAPQGAAARPTPTTRPSPATTATKTKPAPTQTTAKRPTPTTSVAKPISTVEPPATTPQPAPPDAAASTDPDAPPPTTSFSILPAPVPGAEQQAETPRPGSDGPYWPAVLLATAGLAAVATAANRIRRRSRRS